MYYKITAVRDDSKINLGIHNSNKDAMFGLANNVLDELRYGSVKVERRTSLREGTWDLFVQISMPKVHVRDKSLVMGKIIRKYNYA